MSSNGCTFTRPALGMKWWKALLLTLPMSLLTALMLSGGQIPRDGPSGIAALVAYLFLNILFFLMLWTGKTDRYRATLFVVISICFVITFISSLLEVRGSMSLSAGNMIDGETPFCHLVIPMILIPAALTKTIIFPGHLLGGFAPILGMVVLWLGASLTLGRGWCSWPCFFGGLDEGFSRLLRKPVIKRISEKWTYLPHAVLVVAALTSAAVLSPTYCEWLCPFKAVTEYAEVTSFRTLVQTVIFIGLFAALVVVLPILTRRRIQCGLFCPFASFQSFTNKLNVFDMRIDTDRCTNCGTCVQNCPTFSLSAESVKRGRTLLSCTKCGRCVDLCPKKAAHFHIKGTPPAAAGNGQRLLFLYPAFLFAATMGSGSIAGAVVRFVRLLT
jgi:polyferredoxin